MPLQACRVHGNALTVEQPGVLSSTAYHFGWGADVSVLPGKSSWFHIPVPTPVLVSDARTQFQKFFLLFETMDTHGVILSVHIYDGPNEIQVFDNLQLQGAHRSQLVDSNTFNLPSPYTVLWGISISFLFEAKVTAEGPNHPARLIVASAGADFFT